MDFLPAPARRARLLVFFAGLAVALAWALVTDHVWEDFYITYRSSKNLATGHGLVFNHGERVHTFTSPLGALVPAAILRLTGTSSDQAVIWIFRVLSAAAFAGALALVFELARCWQYGWFASVAVTAVALLDAKSIDFAINGMETGFLLGFLAYALWAMWAARQRRWLHLGLAWGGLMWTRPDSFVYIGLLAAGAWLFNDAARTGLTRRQWFKIFLQAGAVCTVLYLPWFVWAWWYYGSPVPHTVVAKGQFSPGQASVVDILRTVVGFPWTVWGGRTSLESTFLPSYFQIGGWPAGLVYAARALALLLAFQWVWPRWRAEIRIASFAFCGMHVYLSHFSHFPFPWYMPGTTLLAAVVTGGILAQLRSSAARAARPLALGFSFAAATGLATEGWLVWQMMRQMRVEQELSANAVRKQTGLWLREHAQPGDTVFMEPLGYIGYFSGLKTYDYPGLSSPEMVRAIRAVGPIPAWLIEYLCPDWLVLRPFEIDKVREVIPRLMDETYQYATEFNTLEQVRRLALYGRAYVEHDAHWIVYHRQKPKRCQVDVTDPATVANYPLPYEAFGDQPALPKLHATGLVSFKVPAWARHVRIEYGLPPGTYAGTPATDGARFVVRLFDGKVSHTVLDRFLNPVRDSADRGVQVFETDLPPPKEEELEIILFSQPGPTDVMDWCCWGKPEFTK
ncbi:MAG: hypothetical protein A3G75_12030 [Verrucomicrobia bacterium RIFCSPLOWO2_12_FULL_64_8]|nr:MAG: hypothetical protein A3G75_12030 [Verrucomicrobia bacterium RIFCSPLOWO2_12_FULL_64_8]